ncbi:DUF192 domain-containing protein [Pelagovum pacificum]|uniref:DUF192 domain-containing protein n=1 Tax=Pelagovum pacificum TaxID=2588711 RepID=A0A5C5GEI1_9RHOB|nr:DUF192 domain-containing protein [Pelagovum pacificum]QQA44527.1 DUF192 domain-containing protein [Pelagovum pacificum]TNY32359.1 DUF192 domain-containing protein [Pelagovum pacificum]
MGSGIERLAAAAAIFVTLAGQGAAQSLCADDRVTVIGDFGQARFTVSVADDNQERARGLMYVQEMPTMAGMLFVYERPQPASFWMENTLIPLDMIFAGEDGTVETVHAEAQPLDRTSIFGGDEIKYVLEINGGLAEQLGIEPGAILQHPMIGPEAAAPCG